MASGAALSQGAVEAIRHAGRADGVFVSTTSAWEIGLLSRPRPAGRQGPQFWPDAKTWFATLMTKPGLKEAPITAAIAIEASFLPGDLHADPADRFIIATARHLGMPIVTRDRRILDYAEAGYAHAIAC